GRIADAHRQLEALVLREVDTNRHAVRMRGIHVDGRERRLEIAAVLQEGLQLVQPILGIRLARQDGIEALDALTRITFETGELHRAEREWRPGVDADTELRVALVGIDARKAVGNSRCGIVAVQQILQYAILR